MKRLVAAAAMVLWWALDKAEQYTNAFGEGE